MFKKLLITLVALTGMAFGQAVHTPTLEGTYTWTGSDAWTFGNLHFLGSIPQCPSGEVVGGLTENFTPNCVAGGGAAGFNWTANLGASQGSTDTTLTLSSTVSGLQAPGTFLVDGEFETFTTITGAVLSGITRGVSLTTPTSHGNGALVNSVNQAFSPFTQAPWGGLYGGNGSTWMSLNCGTPSQFADAGTLIALEVNCGGNETWIDTAGRIHQTNDSVTNFFAPFYVAPGLASNLGALHYPLSVTNTTYLVQTNGQYQYAQPVGMAGTYGPLTTQPVPTIPAATVAGEMGGSCSATYVLAGLDLDGNGIPGTPVTLTGLLPWIAGVQGLVTVQAPQVAGVATWNLYRTAISGSCGIVTTTGLLATTTVPYPFFQDSAITGDSTTPPASNGSIAKQCVGTAGNAEAYCHLSGTSGTPPISCSSAVYGWDYTNVSATSGATLHCYSGQTTWMATDSPSGITSINGDATSAQHIAVSGTGLSIVDNGTGTHTIVLSGSAGTGAVTASNFGQLGGFAATGGSTTVGGSPNVYALNPAWTLAQMNALFSRFSGVATTSWAIVSNVVTFQGPNSFSAGDGVLIGGLTTGSYINGFTLTVTSATATAFVASGGGFTHANASATEAGTAGIVGSAGLVIIPPGMTDAPGNAFNNSAAQILDTRKGYAPWQQVSQYGVKCDASSVTTSITSGATTIFVGSTMSTANIGQTMIFAQQVGYGNTGLQEDWEPIITGWSGGTATLSSAAPFSYSGAIPFGTNNQVALQRAFNAVGGLVPLNFPTGCQILSDTIRWNGANMLGQQMQYTGLVGFPGHDNFQQQDGLPITAWSINTSTGVTTFTIPAYAAHNILPQSLYPAASGVTGDRITLENFPTSTFFNNQIVTIATQPTPTTFTVNSVFSQSTSSATEAGLGAPTTSANTNAMRVENISFAVHNGIDPSYKWNHYNGQTAALTVAPPYYRPLQENYSNTPFGPAWGTGQVNGVATIAQNSAVICAPTATGARQPAVGTTIVFPYQTGGLVSRTVSSTAGSCSAGFTARTLSSALPNSGGYTATQAEWFTYTTPQTLAYPLPATITYPWPVYLNLQIDPVSSAELNLASHGRIEINGDQFDYAGDQFGGTSASSFPVTAVANASGGSSVYTGTFSGITCTGTQPVVIAGFSTAHNNGTFLCSAVTGTTITVNNTAGTAQSASATLQTPAPTLFIRNGPTTINGGTGDAVGAVVFPMNPCQAMYGAPWPVVPTINTNATTPASAIYYAGLCGGNAALSFPQVDSFAWTPFNSGMSVAYFNNVAATNVTVNPLGNPNNNGSMFLYQQGNNTAYGVTYDNIRISGLWGAFMQGPASVNQWGLVFHNIGPTSTGQSIRNCSIHSAYAFTLYSMAQSNIDRCDTYSTGVSQLDGTAVGGSTGLDLGYSLSETTGAGITGIGQFTVKDYNAEPENGNSEEVAPSVVSDANNVTWLGTIFEGGYNILGGSFQQFHGTQLAGPSFNYGTNNYFDKMYGTVIGFNDAGIYNGALSFYNWGKFGTCEMSSIGGGPNQNCGAGFTQSWNGHDAWATIMGDLVHPSYNVLGGVISPDEFNLGASMPVVFDSTELWWGKHSECGIGTGLECIGSEFDGFAGYIAIGPFRRITNAKMVLKTNLKLSSSGTASVRILFTAQDGLGTGCTPNFALAAGTFTVTSTGWTPVQVPVDFTNYAGCTLGVQIDQGSATNTLQVGYFNLVPFTSQLYIPLGTHNVGDACPVAGEISVDSTHLWTCQPSSGVTFGPGTWQEH